MPRMTLVDALRKIFLAIVIRFKVKELREGLTDLWSYIILALLYRLNKLDIIAIFFKLRQHMLLNYDIYNKMRIFPCLTLIKRMTYIFLAVNININKNT